MRLNIFVNEMASFGPFSAFIKGCIAFCSSGRNGDRPTRRDDNPQDTEVFAVERHGFPEQFVSFCALCGVQCDGVVQLSLDS